MPKNYPAILTQKMSIFHSNYLWASLLVLELVLVLPLPSSARTVAETPTLPVLSRGHYGRRGLEQGEQHFEDYLPDIVVTETWLFGAGDLSELNLAGDGSAGAPPTAATALSRIAPAPLDVPALLAGEYVASVSAGGMHAALLTNEGRVLTAGTAGARRGLGRNAMEPGFRPVEEVYPLDDDASPASTTTGGHSTTALITSSLPKFVKVVASQDYTFAVDDAGDVWSTGNNAYGQLCLNDTTPRDRFHQVRLSHKNNNNKNLFDRWHNKVIDVALGERHVLLLMQDGRVFGCGWNAFGQLGIGRRGGNVASPVEISIDAPDNAGGSDDVFASKGREINYEVVTNVVAGRGSSYFLTESGHVYATGTNFKGQLCLGHRDDRTLPAMLDPIETFLHTGRDFSYLDEGVGVASIAAGSSSFYLLLSNGILLACGENTHGQLGIGNNNIPTNSIVSGADAVVEPTPITNVANVTAVYSGPTSYGAYFVSDHSVYAVGFDGAGLRENWDVPCLLACANEGASVERGLFITAGDDVTLYLATAETTLACQGGIVVDGVVYTAAPTTGPTEEPTTDPTAEPTTMDPTMSPTRTMPPTATRAPTLSPAPTERPSVSGGPSGVPTVTAPPTFSVAPTSNSTYFPTLSPTPAPVEELRSPRPSVRNGGADGCLSFGLDQYFTLGTSLFIMWQWL